MHRLFWVNLWGVSLMLASVAMAQEAPTHRWSISDPTPRLGNRLLLSLAVCDARRFAWAPVLLPRQPGLLSRFEAEIAIEKHDDGQPCVGTRWSWTVLPVQSGDLILETVRLQASRFGQPIDYAIPGPRISVSAPPAWLPGIVANRRPAVFHWMPEAPQRQASRSEATHGQGFVQQTLRLQSSLSRDALEKWIALMLEDQPAWGSLPPLITPAPSGLGDDFFVTFFAHVTPPEIPALRLQMTMLNPQTRAIERLSLERPAEAVPQTRPTTVARLVMLWSHLYHWGQQQLLWLSGLALLFVFLFTRFQKDGWRLQRLWLKYRLKSAKTYATVWKTLRTNPWLTASAPQTTPRAWARGVNMGIDDPAHRSALWAAVTALERGLFSESPSQDIETMKTAFIQVLKEWRI